MCDVTEAYQKGTRREDLCLEGYLVCNCDARHDGQEPLPSELGGTGTLGPQREFEHRDTRCFDFMLVAEARCRRQGGLGVGSETIDLCLFEQEILRSRSFSRTDVAHGIPLRLSQIDDNLPTSPTGRQTAIRKLTRNLLKSPLLGNMVAPPALGACNFSACATNFCNSRSSAYSPHPLNRCLREEQDHPQGSRRYLTSPSRPSAGLCHRAG